MKQISCLTLIALFVFSSKSYAQDDYELAKIKFNENNIDAARFFINKKLQERAKAQDYFLSGIIHEAENKPLRAVADYEAVIQLEPNNLEAFFQKGLIYYNATSIEQAIKDFTYVILNQKNSETHAIYFVNDPLEAKGTSLTTLQSMFGKIYQYRGLAYEKIEEYQLALLDFNTSFEYDSSADLFINRSLLFAKMGNQKEAISDLKAAIQREQENYLAWYNLAVLDPHAKLPKYITENEKFVPILHLMGANAYEQENFQTAASYYSKSIKINPKNEQAHIGKGKALLRLKSYSQAKKHFITAFQLNPERIEIFQFIGNALFYENNFSEAITFYEKYLDSDTSYGNAWFNTAMAYLSLKKNNKACNCLSQARRLGIKKADKMLDKYCASQ